MTPARFRGALLPVGPQPVPAAPVGGRFASRRPAMPAHRSVVDTPSPGTNNRPMPMSSAPHGVVAAILLALLASAGTPPASAQEEIVVVGGEGRHCGEDPQCFNRLHPAIPLAARAQPGQTIVLPRAERQRLRPSTRRAPTRTRGRATGRSGTVHPLAGPVHIEGAEPGDVLAVTLLDVAPGRFGYTSVSPIGFVSDHVSGAFRANWRLDRTQAVSDDLPGVRIPNASFPGIVTVLPGPAELAAMLAREAELRAVGGAGFPPYPVHASPAAVCGPDGSHPAECLRTLPPREHGGNLDIRYLQVGVTLYLPCYVEGLRTRHRRPALRAGRRRGLGHGDRDGRRLHGDHTAHRGRPRSPPRPPLRGAGPRARHPVAPLLRHDRASR